MLGRLLKAAVTRILTPIAAFLLRMHVSPDVITWIGTIGVSASAWFFYPQGELFWGTVVITLFVFSDTLDGTMARMSGRSSSWGAFLDSTLDRVGDASVFGALLWWFLRGGDAPDLAVATVICLVGGMLVSYAKARAEGLGMTADVGIAARSDRLVAVLVATGLAGLDVPYVQAVTLWALAAATVFTVFQRMIVVRRQAFPREPAAETQG